MRIWRLALPSAIALAALVVGGCGGSKSTDTFQPPPQVATGSSGNASISVAAKKTRAWYNRNIVVSARDKKTGAPVRGAEVSVSSIMTSPHKMPLAERPLKEISRGKYEGPYTFIMKGQWTLTVIVRSDKLGASTSQRSIKVGG